MDRKLFPGVLLIALFSMVSACSLQPAGVALSHSQPALHAVQDKELRDLMDRMNGLMMERFMTEQEMDVQRARFAGRIIVAAQTLADTAAALIGKLPELGLHSDQGSAFRILSEKLAQQAVRLRAQAENGQFNGMSATLHEMTSTCMACHTLFRKI